MSRVYYNDNDKYCVAWLRELIKAGELPAGDVDERDINEVGADDLRGYRQVHLFAGIGGWPLALEWAGWADRPVWTGSCPCQPFSVAGKRKGHEDKRDLWPVFRRLIEKCGPATIFGEQVASPLGLQWFVSVRTDLEARGYAVGGADLPAASVGGPHIRQRIFWVADAGYGQGRGVAPGEVRGGAGEGHPDQVGLSGSAGGLAHGEGKGGRGRQQMAKRSQEPGGLRQAGGVGDSDGAGLQGRCDRSVEGGDQGAPGAAGAPAVGLDHGDRAEGERLGRVGVPVEPERAAGGRGHADAWSDSVIVLCGDGKARPVGTGVWPLAHGFPGRVGQLRGYGNAIVPQAAATFVRAFMES